MTFIKIKHTDKNSSFKIFYQEYGTGKPVLFIHGWPLNHEMWEYQLNELLNTTSAASLMTEGLVNQTVLGKL
jgi:peroxiredoxin